MTVETVYKINSVQVIRVQASSVLLLEALIQNTISQSENHHSINLTCLMIYTKAKQQKEKTKFIMPCSNSTYKNETM